VLGHALPQGDPKRLRRLEQQVQAIGIEPIFQLRRALRTLLLSGKRTGNEVAQHPRQRPPTGRRQVQRFAQRDETDVKRYEFL
jgi:hypothetical protein